MHILSQLYSSKGTEFQYRFEIIGLDYTYTDKAHFLYIQGLDFTYIGNIK